jgi:hypothetical protein
VRHALCLILALGCGLDPMATDDSGANQYGNGRGDADSDTDVDADTDADADADITYPTAGMNNILLYRGHGGADGTDTYSWGVFSSIIPNHWSDSHGWTTNWQPNMPSTDGLSSYRMVGLMAPGASGRQPFGEADVSSLKHTMVNGTRIVLFADRTACDNPHSNTLLEDLGVSMRLTGNGAGERMLVTDAEVVAGHPITQDVESVELTDPCYISKGDATPLITWLRDGDRRVLAAVERPGSGGDVVIMGDFQILDDTGHFYQADNHQLVDNLAMVEPQ